MNKGLNRKRKRTLARIEIYPRVRAFLNSISRVNEGTARSYNFDLSHFQTFLEKEYKDYDVETVITAIQENKLDVYSLLISFVGYLSLRLDGNKYASTDVIHN